MNRNVKDYLILKGDFDFAIPWITLPRADCKAFHFQFLGKRNSKSLQQDLSRENK